MYTDPEFLIPAGGAVGIVLTLVIRALRAVRPDRVEYITRIHVERRWHEPAADDDEPGAVDPLATVIPLRRHRVSE